MNEEEGPEVALLVVRAWRDAPDLDHVRARIWTSMQLPEQPLRVRVVASIEELNEVVTQWMRDLRHG